MSKRMLARRTRLAFAIAFAMAAVAAGCGSDEGGTTTTTKASVVGTGSFAVTIDGQSVTVDYTGGETTVEIVHKLNPDATGYGCITSLRTRFAKADGTCPLTLRYEPKGETLALVEATFAAAEGVEQGGVVISTKPCVGFPGADQGKELVYSLAGGNGTLSTPPVGPGEANLEKATLKGRTLAPKGTIQLQNKGKLFDLDTGKFAISGDFESTGSASVSCGTAVGTDLCPQGVSYGNTVGSYVRRPGETYACSDSGAFDFGEFCGKPLLLFTYQHWLANPDRNPNHETFSGKAVLQDLGKLQQQFGDDIAIAVVVLSGEKKVVVENPAQPGSYMASGPAPTPADCEAIRTAYGIPEGVQMLYDKDKVLNGTDKRLVDANFTPSLLTADASGKILQILPGSDGKMETAAVEAAIQAAIAAN